MRWAARTAHRGALEEGTQYWSEDLRRSHMKFGRGEWIKLVQWDFVNVSKTFRVYFKAALGYELCGLLVPGYRTEMYCFL
jgi:hypothetical protein